MLTAERTPADSMHTDFTVLAFCVVSLTAVDDKGESVSVSFSIDGNQI